MRPPSSFGFHPYHLGILSDACAVSGAHPFIGDMGYPLPPLVGNFKVYNIVHFPPLPTDLCKATEPEREVREEIRADSCRREERLGAKERD